MAAAKVVGPGQRAEVVHAAKVAFVSGFNEILLIGSMVVGQFEQIGCTGAARVLDAF